MSISNIFSAKIQELDVNGQTLARREISASDTSATAGEFNSGYLADTSQTTIGLPITQVRQLWLRNTHSSAKITVVWTPNGGASATVIILGPNDQCMFWHNNTGTSYGISSLKLTSDTSAATYELFIGG